MSESGLWAMIVIGMVIVGYVAYRRERDRQ